MIVFIIMWYFIALQISSLKDTRNGLEEAAIGQNVPYP